MFLKVTLRLDLLIDSVLRVQFSIKVLKSLKYFHFGFCESGGWILLVEPFDFWFLAEAWLVWVVELTGFCNGSPVQETLTQSHLHHLTLKFILSQSSHWFHPSKHSFKTVWQLKSQLLNQVYYSRYQISFYLWQIGPEDTSLINLPGDVSEICKWTLFEMSLRRCMRRLKEALEMHPPTGM